MHLLYAVREEVTELRQRIQKLHEKVISIEHENAFLRQYVSSEIYAQYTPLPCVSSFNNDPASSLNSVSAILPSQTVSMACPTGLSSSLIQQSLPTSSI
jgi:hypothetical protein